MAGGAECDEIFGSVVLGDAVVVMHVQGQFAPFRFGQVVCRLTGAQTLAAAFGTAPSGSFFDSQCDFLPIFGVSRHFRLWGANPVFSILSEQYPSDRQSENDFSLGGWAGSS